MPFSFVPILNKLNQIVDKAPFLRLREVLSVCIEDHSIKLVELNLSSETPVIKNFAVLQLPKVESNNQEEFGEVAKETVRRALEKGGFKVKQVFVSLTSGSVFLRKITLPKIPLAELEEAIRWEASNQIPFSMETAYFDWQWLAETRSKEGVINHEYMIAACSRASVDFLTDLLIDLGLKPVCVGLPAFAISTIYKKCTHIHPGEDVAFVDIGSKKTNIVVFRGEVLNFAREVPIGYETMDDILFTELPALRSAVNQGYIEVIKSSCDFTTLENRSEEVLPGISNQRLYSAFTTFFERLFSEMGRSFDYFKTQVSDFGLCRIYLSGIGTHLIHMERCLRMKFEVPIEIIQPVPFFQFDESVNKQAFLENFPQLLLILGSALGSFQQINFFPVDYLEKRREKIYAGFLAGFVVFALLIWGGLGFYYGAKIDTIRKEIQGENRKIEDVRPQVKELKEICEQFLDDYKSYEALEESREMLSVFLKELSQNLNKNIFLKKIDYSGHELSLEGYVVEDKEGDRSKEDLLVDFIIRLNESPWVVQASLISSELGKDLSEPHNVFKVKCSLYSRAELLHVF